MAIGILAAIGFVTGPLTSQTGTEGTVGSSTQLNQSVPQKPHSKNGTACGLDDPCPPGESPTGPVSNSYSSSESVVSQSKPSFSSQSSICLDYWYSPECSHCARIKDLLYESKRDPYPNLEIREHNAKQQMDVDDDFLAHYGVSETKRGKVPIVYLGQKYCIGDEECLAELSAMFEACLPDGCGCQNPEKVSALKVGPVGVASLAAVDAVNVCVLAVLLVLITAVLTKFPENRRMKDLLGAGISPQAAYVVGLIVSSFLLPRALGPNFVASGLLAGLPVPQTRAWLVLHNIVFILPMMAIAFAVYGGFPAVKNIEEWRQENLKTLHVVAGAILCGLGGATVAGFI